MLQKYWTKIYDNFLGDAVRVYRVMDAKFRVEFWIILVLNFIQALLEVCMIFSLSFFGASLASPDFTRQTKPVKFFMESFPTLGGQFADDRFYIGCICFSVIFFIAAKNLVAFVAMRKSAIYGEKLTAYITGKVLQGFFSNNYYWHISSKSGDTLQRLFQRSSLSALVVTVLLLYGNMLCSIMLFAALFIAEPALTSIVLAVFSVVGISLYLAVKRSMEKAGREVNAINLLEQRTFGAATRGIRDIIIYSQQNSFLAQLMDIVKQGLPSRSFMAWIGMSPAWCLETAGFGTVFGVLVFMLAKEYPMPQIISTMALLMLTAWRVLPSAGRILSYLVIICGYRPAALSCLQLLEIQPSDTAGIPVLSNEELSRFPSMKTGISLRKALFSYPDNDIDVLKGVSCEIPKGSSIGLIGRSGAGKSTLALLLSGLVAPTGGAMLVDGVVLEGKSLSAYMKRVGFVPQSPFIVGGTIAENVAFSRWGGDFDRNEVQEACRMAAMDYIWEMPQGIDTPIGEGGAGLSGGQAQRLAIARALFTKPDVIIFDEATSALDHVNENVIQETIRSLKGRITTVIIAHRLSTVAECDLLFWMEDGKITMQGPPETVLPAYTGK